MNTEQENFINNIRLLSEGTIPGAFLGCLAYRTGDLGLEFLPPINTYAARFFDKSDPVGNRLLRISLNDNEERTEAILEFVLREYRAGNVPENHRLNIDPELLQSVSVTNFLRTCHQDGYINYLNICNPNYVLDEATYNRISFMNGINVYGSSVVQPNVYINTKLLNFRIGYNSDLELENDFFLTEDLTDDEIREMINNLHQLKNNNNLKQKICIRFYNPARSANLIKRFDDLGLDKDVEFEILGYPLSEYADAYNPIDNIANTRKINVTYVCCHDLLRDYCKEPFEVENAYHSELEPEGKTSFDLYKKVLEFVNNYERSVDGIDSTIEKTMIAYQYLNEHYGYDADSGTTKDYAATRNIDRLMTTDEIVCVGYANLLTLMCRRVNIPMFTYAAPRHRMNVARIIEKDDAGNVVFDKICTFDPTNDCGYFQLDENGDRIKIEKPDSYTYFGIDPARWLSKLDAPFLTLANSLALPVSELEKYEFISKTPFEVAYSNYYSCESFRYSMLRLMGYDVAIDNYNDVLSELQAQDRIGEIPSEMIENAAKNIEGYKHPELSADALAIHNIPVMGRIISSISFDRCLKFPMPDYYINLNYAPGSPNVAVNTYHEQIDDHQHIDLEAIDHGPRKFDNLSDLPNGDRMNDTQSYSNDHVEDNAHAEDTTPDTVEPETPDVNSNPSSDSVSQPSSDTSEEPAVIEEPDPIDDHDHETIPDETIIPNGNPISEEPFDIGMFSPEDFSDEFIAGTRIRKPRARDDFETNEEYAQFLDRFYTYYFPRAEVISRNTYCLTRDHIIQDFPIYSNEEQNFEIPGMSDEEIEESQRKIRI